MTKNLQKNLVKYSVILTFSLLLIIPVVSVFAQSGGNTVGAQGGNTTGAQGGGNSSGGSPNIKIGNPFNKVGGENPNLYTILYAVLDNAVLPVGGVVVAIMIIYSGFLFVTAQGSEDKISTARRSFTYAAIGAAILLGAKALALAIESTINALR